MKEAAVDCDDCPSMCASRRTADEVPRHAFADYYVLRVWSRAAAPDVLISEIPMRITADRYAALKK